MPGGAGFAIRGELHRNRVKPDGVTEVGLSPWCRTCGGGACRAERWQRAGAAELRPTRQPKECSPKHSHSILYLVLFVQVKLLGDELGVGGAHEPQLQPVVW